MFSIYRKLFLALQRVQMLKINPSQVPTTPQKDFPPAKFLIPPPLNAI